MPKLSLPAAKSGCVWSVLLTCALLAQPAWATASNAAETTPMELSAGVYLQAFFSLLFILALLFGAAWLGRRLSAGKGFGQAGMKVLGGVALGPRERLVLVEVGNICLVVGIVPGQIRTLHQLPRSEVQLPPADTARSFRDWLNSKREMPHE